jgi:hypothetical protein
MNLKSIKALDGSLGSFPELEHINGTIIKFKPNETVKEVPLSQTNFSKSKATFLLRTFFCKYLIFFSSWRIFLFELGNTRL